MRLSHTSSSDCFTRTKPFPISLNLTWKTLTQTQMQTKEPNTDTSIHASDMLVSTSLVKRESIVNVQYVPCKYPTKACFDYRYADDTGQPISSASCFHIQLQPLTHTKLNAIKKTKFVLAFASSVHLPLAFTHNCKHSHKHAKSNAIF